MPTLDELHFDPLVFWQSRVNGAPYNGESLPVHPWLFPRGTWFTHRLAYVREMRKEQKSEVD